LGNWQELAKQQAELAIAITDYTGIALAERYYLVDFAAESTNSHQSSTTKHSLHQAELVVGHLE